MDVVFNETFREFWEGQFLISEKEIIDSVHNPDKSRKIKLDIGWTYGFFLKKLDSKNYLFVTSELRGPECIVGFVFKIPQKIIDQIGSMEPLVVLEQCANRIGVPIQAGNTQGHFIMSETFKIPLDADPYKCVRVVNPQNSPNGNILIFMFRDGIVEGIRHLNVELVYAIDFKKYFEWFEE